MGEKQIDKKIAQANDRLGKAKLGIKIYRRGDRLSLRATFPPKPPAEGKPKPQWLSLGTYAHYEGVAAAEREAKRIGGMLACKEFDWDKYLGKASPETVGDHLEALRQKKIEIDDIKESSFKHDYCRVFKNVMDAQISMEVLQEIVLDTGTGTKTRRRTALACGALADIAGLDGSALRNMKGDYGTKRLSPRDLPTDEQIARAWHSIQEEAPEWAYVYALMAIFGIRNHEVFSCDLEDYPLLWVSRGKTGERYVYPFYPEWLEAFKVRAGKLPTVNRKDNEGYGQAVTKGLGKYVSFTPYNLRHCWAVRTIGLIDIALAAAQMGHTVAVHQETYYHWITRDTHQKAFDLYLGNPNRPKPPII